MICERHWSVGEANTDVASNFPYCRTQAKFSRTCPIIRVVLGLPLQSLQIQRRNGTGWSLFIWLRCMDMKQTKPQNAPKQAMTMKTLCLEVHELSWGYVGLLRYVEYVGLSWGLCWACFKAYASLLFLFSSSSKGSATQKTQTSTH